jgi:predicted DNA-binding ribbon-helix-helix protein
MTTVKGIRLNDYQLKKLKEIAKEHKTEDTDLVRILIDKLIEGKIQIRNSVIVDGVDLSGLKRIVNKKGLSLQRLIDLIVEQLNESSE